MPHCHRYDYTFRSSPLDPVSFSFGPTIRKTDQIGPIQHSLIIASPSVLHQTRAWPYFSPLTHKCVRNDNEPNPCWPCVLLGVRACAFYAVTPSRPAHICALRTTHCIMRASVRGYTRKMRQERRRGRGKMLPKLLRIKARFVVGEGIRPVPPEAITQYEGKNDQLRNYECYLEAKFVSKISI